MNFFTYPFTLLFTVFSADTVVKAEGMDLTEILIIGSNILLALVTIHDARKSQESEQRFMVKILRLVIGGKAEKSAGAHKAIGGRHE